MSKTIFMIGGGGHGKVLLDALIKKNISIDGILDTNPNLWGKKILNIPILGDDEILKNYPIPEVLLINAIGSIHLPTVRTNIFEKKKSLGYQFLNIIHPTSSIGSEVIIGEGVQLMAGSIIQPGCKLGNNVIVNTQASIDHDSKIGDHVHIAPGVICCGDVEIGARTHIGSGAVLLQGVTIGSDCLIAAGSIVIRNVPANSKIKGIPAKIMG